jgi:hypothetical protein
MVRYPHFFSDGPKELVVGHVGTKFVGSDCFRLGNIGEFRNTAKNALQTNSFFSCNSCTLLNYRICFRMMS